ncbi:pyridoxamine 5'-phosphate oxidase family protein [Roseomonas sp. CAU 1739]|uniref:pyridoxamine 5'-phosphate oxidase family protein n=1 Tax=Roseomonas sp. CAU 1739 TaxID=3140364 RepID=UPI00325A874E
MIRTPPATLDAALAAAFAALANGVQDHRSAFHTPTLATCGLDGAPSLRSVVLRHVDARTRILHIHTDRRSAKVAELAADPRVALHGYDPAARLQLRLAGHASLHHDDTIAEAAWAASRETSRMTYATAHQPGTPLPAPPDAPGDPFGGRAHFAAVVLRFESLDWLLLDPAGHRRARFTWDADGVADATWLAP